MSQGRGFLGQRNLETIPRTGACLLGLMLSGSGLLYALLYGQAAPPAAKEKEIALQVIVVSTPELASQLLEKLKAGSDFATLAKEKSIDPRADTAGFTGRMDLATLRPELLTISFDPVHDQPETLAEYGRTWNIDPKGWHLLTGPPAEVQKFCERFGVAFFPDEGQLIHSLHTLIIDRHGKMAVNLEGNEFTPQELGDLVQSMLNGSTSSKAH